MFNEGKIAPQIKAKNLLAPLSPEEVNEKYTQVINDFDSFNSKASYEHNDALLLVDIFANVLEILSLLEENQRDEVQLRIISVFKKVSHEEILLSTLAASLRQQLAMISHSSKSNTSSDSEK